MQMRYPSDQRAQSARVLVAISFHFDFTRLGFLGEVLRSLSEFAVAAIEVVVLTNVADAETIAPLQRLCHETLGDLCQIRSYADLANPWDLTWRHKAIISDEFIDRDHGDFTHFIYLEGDIRLTFANFCYWLEFRDLLRPAGLLPAFVRMEYRAAVGGYAASDAFWPIYVPAQSYLRINDMFLVNMPNPYNPFYLLDRELAREYVSSPSFDQGKSIDVGRWGISERAAMGLCLENVPIPFQSRYVVPISARTGKTPPFAWTLHIPNNYASNPRSPLGKVRMDSLFVGVNEAVTIDRWGVREHGEPPHLGGIKLEFDAMAAGAAPESQNLFYLVTDHDTMVYLDQQTSHLKHAPLGIAPLNLVLQTVGSQARVWTVLEEGSELRQLHFSSHDGTVNPELGRSAPDCGILPIADLVFGVRIGEHYLSASVDGLIHNDRPHCQRWEHYRFLRADSIRGLSLLRRYSWLSHDDRRILCLADQPLFLERSSPWESSALAATLAPGAIEFRRRLVFGPARLPLVSREQVITTGPSDDSRPPPHLEIRATPGGAYRFSRFAPLVHYRLAGGNAAYECLRLSLTSLVGHGGYRGAISIACDRPEESLFSYLPEELHSRVTLARISAADAAAEDGGLDPALQGRHQPILLAAPDVIFDANIVDLLIDSMLEGRGRVSVAGECAVGRGLRHFPEAPSEAGRQAMQAYLAGLGRDQAAGDRRAIQLNLTLPGPMSGEELDRLARLARCVPRHGTIIEIGAASSRSSWVLAANADPSVTVYCIEQWSEGAGEESPQSLTTFRANLAAFANVIALSGRNPGDFVGWQREIDLLVENTGKSDPARFGSLSFWRRLLRPEGVVCGRLPGGRADEVLTDVADLARNAGAELERTGNLWSFKPRSASGTGISDLRTQSPESSSGRETH
jgi:hypothetical protein